MWGCNSAVEYLLRMQKAPGSNPGASNDIILLRQHQNSPTRHLHIRVYSKYNQKGLKTLILPLSEAWPDYT